MDTNKDLQEQRHPSALSADELEALKASDPTAFDEDEDEGEAADDTPDPELLKAVAGDEAPAVAAAADRDDAFLRGKVQAARYFCAFELPKVEAWLSVVAARDPTCREMQEAWFES